MAAGRAKEGRALPARRSLTVRLLPHVVKRASPLTQKLPRQGPATKEGSAPLLHTKQGRAPGWPPSLPSAKQRKRLFVVVVVAVVAVRGKKFSHSIYHNSRSTALRLLLVYNMQIINIIPLFPKPGLPVGVLTGTSYGLDRCTRTPWFRHGCAP